MDVRFLAQPMASSESLDDFIDVLSDHAIERISIVAAWAKRSGLARIADRINSFRGRGGVVDIIVGVSEGGATREGLQLAMDLSDRAFVFHDPRRTFHPKVYLASGRSRRELLVGSSNLTAGGLGWNYESSVWLSESSQTISQPFDDADRWISELLVQPMSCRRLDRRLLSDLLSSSDIRIGSESNARRISLGTTSPEDSDGVATGSVTGLFSAPALVMRPLRPAPGVTSGTIAGTRPTVGSPVRLTTAVTSTAAAASGAPVLRRWSRDLDNTAAQQVVGANSHPTGNLRLTQAGHAIRHQTYFYQDLFGGLPWTPSLGKSTEQEVLVDFDCVVDGVRLGIETLRMSHDPSRISSQSNVPTVLHWGRTLRAALRSKNFVGQFVSIERLADDSFRLTIDTTPTGPLVA